LTRTCGPTPDLLRAAEALAQEEKLDQDAVELVLTLVKDAGPVSAEAREAIVTVLERHRAELAADDANALRTYLGPHLGTDRPLAALQERVSAHGSLHENDAVRLARLARAEGSFTAQERQALEQAQRDPRLGEQARHLIEGALLFLPGDAPPGTRPKSGLAQVAALRSAARRRHGRALALDPDRSPVSRARLKELLGVTAAEGHLLVALGVASADESRALLEGQVTLRGFYALAARGHFGNSVDEVVPWAAFRQRLLDVGMKFELERILAVLPEALLARARAGEATPAEIFFHQADARAS
jgi:hypothetical protein